jgi:pyruvate dehydrogenase E2 component (dihydrolipoamide acetyltransferase)
MVIEVIMPKMGLVMTDGRIQKWLRHEGDFVRAGEALFEVATDKAVVEVAARGDGVLRRILVPEGTVVPVGCVVAFLAAPEDVLPEMPARAAAPPAAALPPVAPPPKTEAAGEGVRASPDTLQRVKGIGASPLAKRLAAERGVDLAQVPGSGPGGRITAEDVERYLTALAAAAPAAPPAEPRLFRREPLTAIQSITAQRVTEVQRVPMATLIVEVDATALAEAKQRLEAAALDATYTDLLIKAVALALQQHPLLNASFDGDAVKMFQVINVGLAVAVPNGLVVPSVPEADRQSLAEIAVLRRDLVARARAGKLTPDELTRGTFSITNLGSYGVDHFAPILNPPEAAILGVGQVAERAVVRDGQVVPRRTLTLSLTFDHRVQDGAPAAQFLQTLRRLLENPTWATA